MTGSKRLQVVAGIVLLASGSSPAAGQDAIPNLNAYATMANDYWSHGLSQLASGASLQLSIDYQHDTGFFVGGFATNVEYATEANWEKPREYLLNYYVGYTRKKRDWAFNVSFARYLYPNLSFSYDYDELAFGVSFKNRVTYSATYVEELLGLPYSGWYQELGLTHPLKWGLELGATLGDLSADEIAGGGYTYWNVGLSKAIGHVGLDLRFHEASLDRISALGDPDGDRWVLSVTYGLTKKN
jgi:uncharacterized protein (TIGR02001 family)